jgi:hypothetical protein
MAATSSLQVVCVSVCVRVGVDDACRSGLLQDGLHAGRAKTLTAAPHLQAAGGSLGLGLFCQSVRVGQQCTFFCRQQAAVRVSGVGVKGHSVRATRVRCGDFFAGHGLQLKLVLV